MILNYSNFLNPSPSYPVLSHLGSNSPFLASHFQLGHCKFSVTGSGLVYCGVLKARQETDSHGNWESCSEIHVIGVLHMCMTSISTKQANCLGREQNTAVYMNYRTKFTRYDMLVALTPHLHHKPSKMGQILLPLHEDVFLFCFVFL